MRKSAKGVLLLAIGISLVLLVIKYNTDIDGIERDGVYVIGKIEKVIGAYQGRKAFISYRYRGQTFSGNFVSNEIYVADTGRRVFMKLRPTNPKKYRIEFNIPVPDSITKVPFEGWDSLPLKLY